MVGIRPEQEQEKKEIKKKIKWVNTNHIWNSFFHSFFLILHVLQFILVFSSLLHHPRDVSKHLPVLKGYEMYWVPPYKRPWEWFQWLYTGADKHSDLLSFCSLAFSYFNPDPQRNCRKTSLSYRHQDYSVLSRCKIDRSPVRYNWLQAILQVE